MKRVNSNSWSARLDRFEVDEDLGITMSDKQWYKLVSELDKAAYYTIDAILGDLAGEISNE